MSKVKVQSARVDPIGDRFSARHVHVCVRHLCTFFFKLCVCVLACVRACPLKTRGTKYIILSLCVFVCACVSCACVCDPVPYILTGRANGLREECWTPRCQSQIQTDRQVSLRCSHIHPHTLPLRTPLCHSLRLAVFQSLFPSLSPLFFLSVSALHRHPSESLFLCLSHSQTQYIHMLFAVCQIPPSFCSLFLSTHLPSSLGF